MFKVSRLLVILLLLIFGFFLVSGIGELPLFGNPSNPVHKQAGNYYLEHAEIEMESPNVVTAVLADYRAVDTLLETTVVLLAGFAVMLVLFSTGNISKFEEVVNSSYILKISTKLLIPPVQLFALYVLAHGHHSPGGGFQCGVILGSSLILQALVFGVKETLNKYPPKRIINVAIFGVLIFYSIGLICFIQGGNFLDYSQLQSILSTTESHTRSLGILFVEIGVSLTVMSVIYLMYIFLITKGEVNN